MSSQGDKLSQRHTRDGGGNSINTKEAKIHDVKVKDVMEFFNLKLHPYLIHIFNHQIQILPLNQMAVFFFLMIIFLSYPLKQRNKGQII